MSIELLREKHQGMLDLYNEHIERIRELQKALLEKHEQDEMEKNFVDDTGSVFRILKREGYKHDALPEAVETTISWRSEHAEDLPSPSDSEPTPKSLFRSLAPAKDTLGNPLALIKLSKITGSSEDLKEGFIVSMERLRREIQASNSQAEKEGKEPVLQFAWIVDVADMSGVMTTSMVSDVLPWLLKEVQPHFYGLSAVMYVMNYSWMYSGIWNVAKLLLPEHILSKILFVSEKELLEYIPSESLPEEYGGTLKLEYSDSSNSTSDTDTDSSEEDEEDENIEKEEAEKVQHDLWTAAAQLTLADQPQERRQLSRLRRLISFRARTKLKAPPPAPPPKSETYRYRSRDLIKTLLVLYWVRYRGRAGLLASALVCVLLWRRRAVWMHV